MKDQYFGDINDYRKYGLLRLLTLGSGLRLGVCWMRTPDDGRNDGHFVRYLNRPAVWRDYDPLLFDRLHQAVSSADRRVIAADSLDLLPGARFWTDLLSDAAVPRRAYMAGILANFADVDLIFFDPDNGLEVRSVSLAGRTPRSISTGPRLSQHFSTATRY